MKRTLITTASCIAPAILVLGLGALPLRAAQTNYLAGLDLSQMSQGWGEPHANLSVGGNPLSIGGQKFDKGLGTHADSELILDLNSQALSFSAMVGVDDEVGTNHGRVTFKVVGDAGKVLWQGAEMHGGDAPVAVNVDLTGVKQVTLLAGTEGSIDFAHADWAGRAARDEQSQPGPGGVRHQGGRRDPHAPVRAATAHQQHQGHGGAAWS